MTDVTNSLTPFVTVAQNTAVTMTPTTIVVINKMRFVTVTNYYCYINDL